MPGTTTRGYPYPLGGDPIDVAGDIQDLAEAIDLDVVNAVKVYASTGDMAATAPRILGNVVYMADGTQWRYDGTKWVMTYAPPTTWINVNLLAPATHLTAPLQVRTHCGYLEFRGGVHMPVLGSNSLIGTLPAGHTPEVTASFAPGIHTPDDGGVNVEFWSGYCTVPNNTTSYIQVTAHAGPGPTPWYGDVDVFLGATRLWMTERTIA
jgi:hypothetical protein